MLTHCSIRATVSVTCAPDTCIPPVSVKDDDDVRRDAVAGSGTEIAERDRECSGCVGPAGAGVEVPTVDEGACAKGCSGGGRWGSDVPKLPADVLDAARERLELKTPDWDGEVFAVVSRSVEVWLEYELSLGEREPPDVDGRSVPGAAGFDPPRALEAMLSDGPAFMLSRLRREKMVSSASDRGKRTTSRKETRVMRRTSNSSPREGKVFAV